jgi:hypothetical protein
MPQLSQTRQLKSGVAKAAARDVVEYALDTLKLDGVTLLTNVCGRYFGDADFGLSKIEAIECENSFKLFP